MPTRGFYNGHRQPRSRAVHRGILKLRVRFGGDCQKGLPTDSIAYLREKGLTFSEVSEIIIAPRTLKHRKARGEQLSVEETGRVLRVARILSMADEVFGNHEKALTWLRRIDERIKDRTPLNMLHTESGGRLVENLLWQIDEGVYS